MTDDETIPVAANVLGTIGTVLCSSAPYIWYNYRRKTTEGLPALMMLLWAICAVPFGVYAIAQNLNIPIQVQPQVFGLLALISWAQCLYYTSGWRLWTSALIAVVLGTTMAGVEVMLILTLRPLYENGRKYPITIIGVVAAVFLAAGLIPPYVEIWKRHGQVVGINFLFLMVDWSGAFFSLMSLVAQNSFDVLGGVLYIICMALETGIFTSHTIWLLRTRPKRKEERLRLKSEVATAAVINRTMSTVEKGGIARRIAEATHRSPPLVQTTFSLTDKEEKAVLDG